MEFPLRAFLVGSLGGGAAITLSQVVRTKTLLAKASVVVLIAEVILWAIYWTFVYPHFVSPLRHLPQPGGNHWLFGHARKLLAEPSAHPARYWLVDGLWVTNMD